MDCANGLRAAVVWLALAALGGCSQYLDRRDTISLHGGDAVAADKVMQMVDPWPPASANKNIGFSGQRMEAAVERYNTNRTYAPSGTGTSGSYQAPPPLPPPTSAPAAPPPAPVK